MAGTTLYLVFALGADRYAIEATSVEEVIPPVRLKGLPGAPAGVAGLLNFRGAPVPVIDLGALATGSPTPMRDGARLIVARWSDESAAEPSAIALLVTHASETMSADPAAFTAPRVTGSARWPGPVLTTPEGVLQRVHVHELLTPELRAALRVPA